MSRARTLVVILAGGAGGRLELLTHERAKPAVAFAGTHRASGLLILQPRMGHDGRDGFPQGTADALWRNAMNLNRALAYGGT